MTGLGFVITFAFVFLKAFDVAALSWLQVFLPVLIGLGIDVVLGIILGLLGANAQRSVIRRFPR